MSKEEVGINKMKEALSSIALEMQRYQSAKDISSANHEQNETEKILSKLSLLHCNIKKKNKMIIKLKLNIQSVINIAKTVFKAKQDESVSLQNRLMNARSEAAGLSSANHSREQALRELTMENYILRTNIEQIHKLIEMSHAKLLKMRNEPHEEIPLPMQLKKIIICCGQYYADYCNEHERRVQVEQTNRFLNNKINLLKINLDASEAELENLRYQMMRLKRQKIIGDRDLSNTIYSECKLHLPQRIAKKKIMLAQPSSRFDLTTHLNLVRRILQDQSKLINEVRHFSDELKNDN